MDTPLFLRRYGFIYEAMKDSQFLFNFVLFGTSILLAVATAFYSADPLVCMHVRVMCVCVYGLCGSVAKRAVMVTLVVVIALP